MIESLCVCGSRPPGTHTNNCPRRTPGTYGPRDQAVTEPRAALAASIDGANALRIKLAVALEKQVAGHTECRCGTHFRGEPCGFSDLTNRLNAMRVQLAESIEEWLAALQVERKLRETLASIEKTLEMPRPIDFGAEHVVAAALNEIRALKPSLWADAQVAFAEKAMRDERGGR